MAALSLSEGSWVKKRPRPTCLLAETRLPAIKAKPTWYSATATLNHRSWYFFSKTRAMRRWSGGIATTCRTGTAYEESHDTPKITGANASTYPRRAGIPILRATGMSRDGYPRGEQHQPNSRCPVTCRGVNTVPVLGHLLDESHLLQSFPVLRRCQLHPHQPFPKDRFHLLTVQFCSAQDAVTNNMHWDRMVFLPAISHHCFTILPPRTIATPPRPAR